MSTVKGGCSLRHILSQYWLSGTEGEPRNTYSDYLISTSRFETGSSVCVLVKDFELYKYFNQHT
jgi:hypothetical protein